LFGDQLARLDPWKQVVGSPGSWASPPVRWNPIGFPNASTRAWILVLNPPRDRPTACASPAFFGAGAVLVGARDGAVDRRVLIVGVGGEPLEEGRPHTLVGPAGEAAMDILPVTTALRQVTPGDTGAIAVEHRLDEQAVVTAVTPTEPSRPGSVSLIRFHWSSRIA